MRGIRRVLAGAGTGMVLAGCATGGVSAVTPTGATLEGTLQSGADPVSYRFQYAKSVTDLGTGAGSATPKQTLAASRPETQVTAPLTGLTPGTTYAYRLCAALPGRDEGCLGTRRFTTPTAGRTTFTFDQPGGFQFTVPAGVTSLRVHANGAAGGSWLVPYIIEAGVPSLSAGGRGAGADATLAVSAGQRLTIRVGGRGADGFSPYGDYFPGAGGKGGTNGANIGGNGGSGSGRVNFFLYPGLGGGGAGGGAPTVVTQFQGATLLVAGGGGGAGNGDSAANGAPQARSGGDGGLVGEDSPLDLGAARATGGTTTAEGAGGASGGRPGYASNGGDGGTSIPTDVPPLCTIVSGQGGGGGGGGWRGGGGGGGGLVRFFAGITSGGGCGGGVEITRAPWAGGAGGSSYAGQGVSGASFTTGAETGDGYVALSWATPAS